MKKIATLAVLPVIALASCSKSNEAPVETTNNVDTTTSEVNTTNETSNTESLNENISSSSTSTESKDFSFNYDLYGKNVNVVGTFALTDGKITAVTFSDKTDFSIGQQPLKMFTDKMSQDLIGKELKGLSIDTVSGASLVSGAFNTYLASLK